MHNISSLTIIKAFWLYHKYIQTFNLTVFFFHPQGHRQTTACTVLFMALYFCCMAAFAWWSCLAFAWFLAAGLKWGHEAIENKSHLFHLVAWAIPALQTISVLALAKVEGECNQMLFGYIIKNYYSLFACCGRWGGSGSKFE